MKSTTIQSKSENQSRHQHSSVRKQVLVSLAILSFLALGTTFAILYARGYRFVFGEGKPAVSKTGILNVTSTPKSAQIYIDGHLTAATDSSINLTPKKYTVKVSKDGFNDWQKDVDIEAEVVTSVDPLLFPKSPTLQSISTIGADEALVDPTGTKLAFKIASQSARRNGIYIFDMTQRSLPILQGQSSSTQLADDTIDRFSEAKISFSPDGRELLASISAQVEPLALENPESEFATDPESELATYYLLKTNQLNEAPQDITATSQNVLELWQEQRAAKEKSRLKALKPKVAEFYKKYFKVLAWSPDEKKILYQASESAEMPVFLNPRRIGNNLRYERRDLQKDAVYVYNITEDLNTRIIGSTEDICLEIDQDCTVTFTWFPDSAHLVYINNRKIHIVEDDGANMTTIYAGPFLGHYVFPWPDGSRIVILTNLGNPNVSPTLYTIGLK
ncbi:MAG TPA: PEGA domain-containing protein [Xanthomonadales bacterium]|nr:PEGA domain-containing protein [Xanthomonadales bacterium]